MLRVAIVDDNLLFVQQARNEVEKVLKDNDIRHHISAFQGGDSFIDAGFFDIAFLDIEMQGLSGMETAEKLRRQDDQCRIVFLTSHREYVFSAFDVSASHYLLKPLDTNKLKEVLMKMVEKLSIYKEYCYTFKCGTQICRVPFVQIEYVEILGRKLTMYKK